MKRIYGWQEFDFLVDTGADVTTLPKPILQVLGLTASQMKRQKTQGVGGFFVETLETTIPIRIGNNEFPIHASITKTEGGSLPFLLRRKDILERRYNLEIDSKNKVTILKKNF